jgi:tetraacyldisaccharide 4'-kinase
MKLDTPRWWYVREGAPAPITRALLKPLSWIWAAATARRIAKGEPRDPGVPVICVGNLTVGGTGKTPIVRELVHRLQMAGQTPTILTRGHGGKLEGPMAVDLARHTAADVGDEPLMLAKDFSVMVSRDRAAGALEAVAEGADIIVMDDGHQNPSVRKTLSLVVVDGETRDSEWPFGDGSVFPAGPMREPLAVGLARADAVIILLPPGLDEVDPELLAVFGDKPVLIARLMAAAPPPGGPQLGFAGVGKPWKVERALRAAGCQLVDFAAFPDHKPYDHAALDALATHAETHGAGLVTTEKDWVRLPAAWRERVTAWPVRAKFDDEAILDALLHSVVTRSSSSAPALR